MSAAASNWLPQRSVNQDNNTIPCHICKMDIPKHYIIDHMKSSIHNNTTQIMNMALERSTASIKANNYQYNLNIEQLDEEFCDICNVSYSFINKLKHKTSEQHKKFVLYDKMLPKICTLFKDAAKNLDVIDEIKEILSETDKISINGADNGNLNKVFNITVNTSLEIQGQKVKQGPSNDIYNKGFGNINNVTTQNQRMVKGTTIMIPSAPTVAKPKDINKINETSVNTTIKPDMVYCDICKVYKSAIGFASHVEGMTHKKKSGLLKTEQSIPNFDTNKTYCDICHVTNGLKCLDIHLNSPKHRDLLYKKILTKNHFTNYISNTPNIEVKLCKICKVDIDLKKVSEHVEGKGHIDKYKNLLFDYNIIKVGSDYFCPTCDVFERDVVKHTTEKHVYLFLYYNETFCDTCRIKIPEARLNSHNNSDLHKNNTTSKELKHFKYIDIDLQDIDEEKYTITVDKKGIACKICMTLLSNFSTIVQHLKGDAHVKKVKDYYRHNGVEVHSKNLHHCKYCNVIFKECILEHINCIEHKEKMSDMFEGENNRTF